jgi:DNA invertase Pin-like site-specific DNA recombinase
MAPFGYARVSTDGQSLTGQGAGLKGAGCTEIFREKVSGAKTDRKQLARVIDRPDEGDILVVTRLDRLARSTRDLLKNALGAVADKGAGFKSLRDTRADTTTRQGQLTPIAPRSRPASLSQWRSPPVVGRHSTAAANCGALLDRPANLV